jgi:hypothetical protein
MTDQEIIEFVEKLVMDAEQSYPCSDDTIARYQTSLAALRERLAPIICGGCGEEITFHSCSTCIMDEG